MADGADVRVRDGVDDMLRARRRSGFGDRDVAVSAMVEVLVVVDNALWRQTMNKYRQRAKVAAASLTKYYGLVFSLVNARYEGIRDPNLKIRVRLAGMFLAEEREDSPWSERITFSAPASPGDTAIDPGKALNGFHEWLKENGGDLPPHDHAMAFTGYKMFGAQGTVPTSGMAFTSTMCEIDEGYSCSVVEEKGGFANVGTCAHELGHSLGAEHDGYGDNADCQSDHNYIMAPASSGAEEYLKNFYHFSHCSTRQIGTFLRSEKASCLLDNQHHVLKTEKVGKLMGADGQCKDIYGSSSGLCPFETMQENICAQLWCMSPDNPQICNTLYPLAAAYGTPCGKPGEGKMCARGECVDEASASLGGQSSGVRSHQSPAAPYRSRSQAKPQRVTGTKSCERDENERYCRDVVSQRRDACQEDYIRGYCCKTCAYYG